MAVPALLLAVDSQIDIHVFVLAPFVHNLVVVHEVVHAAGAVYDVDVTIVFALVADIVDDGMERCQTDAAGDEEQVFAFKRRIHRKTVSVRTADGNLLTHLHGVEPCGQTAALLNAEFHIFLGR